MAPHTQPFTAPSSSHSGMLTVLEKYKFSMQKALVMHGFLFLMVSTCAIPSHHLALKQQVGKLQAASFPSTLLLSAADSLSFPPFLALRQKLVKLWHSVWAAHCSDWYLGCAVLLLLPSAFLHRSPTPHPGVSLVPPASKEPHPCHLPPGCPC